ncbi:TPA: hypothetical protein ACU9K7_003243 [Salmonella enterica]|nr:hypothetical protein [Salmonella enterica subsp. enterica serovar Miami]
MTSRTNSLKQTILLLFILALMSGCSSMEHVKKEKGQHSNYYKLTPSISKGDTLQYKLKTGEEGWFTVAAIKPDSLISTSGKEFFLEQVQDINLRKISTVKTTAAGLGITTIIISSIFLMGAMEAASAALSV